MAICKKKKIINIILNIFFLIIFVNSTYAEVNFENIKEKKVSYLDFFLLKYENKLAKRSIFLRSQVLATRVQYSAINIKVNFEKKSKRINTELYAVMDRNRYSKKNYEQKLRDCNQIRNLIFYRKLGYKLFSQKRDPTLSEGIMEDIFKEVFLNNLTFDDEEVKFLLNNMFIKITIFHPIKKIKLICSGRINDYELK